MNIIPYVIDNIGSVERTYDIYSRLLEDRVIFLNGEITDDLANSIVAQLLFLESKDAKKDINMYINSPGGSITAGLAIFDTMNFLKCDIVTICTGLAASMGAVLLSAGTKGKRMALPNSTVMIHQASSGTSGNIQDQRVTLRYTEELNKKILEILAKTTGKTKNQIEKDTARDNFMFAPEAKEYGLIDTVIQKRK